MLDYFAQFSPGLMMGVMLGVIIDRTILYYLARKITNDRNRRSQKPC